ncbi:hypothetical protein [Flavobacterium hydrophilum]|uniref:Uncharacterized protein n=1 Tax=Flavobacterium hydrophilum TaxID=2211445 RepID=A0A2V4C2H0_9FLAO|nr:hypothetical protein [Flavobacterium hydrophilum]PXY44293.1 hypothetical protein DMB68_17890 [Flavobacterium hydrophilum]
MTRIEIRYSKTFLKGIILVLFVTLIITNYFVYFSDKFDDKPFLKYAYILINLYLIYVLYKNSFQLIKNKPIIILTNESIEISEGKNLTTYNWTEINSFRIENDKNDTKGNYLILETSSLTKTINLNWLEKSPKQIIELINNYKKQI